MAMIPQPTGTKCRWSLRKWPFYSSFDEDDANRLSFMTYVIGSACVDVMDKSCLRDCPVDCIYEGARALYINPNECVDCGACKSICRMKAIYYETDLPQDQRQHLGDNAAFFPMPLPHRDHPLGSPGGASALGRVGTDTPLVAALPHTRCD
jgi:NAD-dependent dihydropyrimidine dehydrogenase PreA subunit